jgi:hypothetical protein
MIHTRTIACAALAAAAAVSLSGLARADTIPISNTTEVAYYSNGSPYDGTGSYWGAPSIGAPVYYTPSGSVSTERLSATTSSITISFTTGLYAGVDTTYQAGYGITVDAGDIFINSSHPTTSPTGSYNYAISLGFDGPDGGHTSPGLYKVTSSSNYYTSNQIWSTSDTWNTTHGYNAGNRADFYYGGEFAPAADFTNGTCHVGTSYCSAGVLAPTVLKSSDTSTVSGIDSVIVNHGETGSTDLGTMSVTIVGTTSVLEGIFDDFDIFWGTGDCSNAPIWGDVSNVSFVPEPSTLAILASALVLLGLADRRRRRAATPV